MAAQLSTRTTNFALSRKWRSWLSFNASLRADTVFRFETPLDCENPLHAYQSATIHIHEAYIKHAVDEQELAEEAYETPVQLAAHRRHASIDREYKEGAGDDEVLAKQIENLKMEAKGKGYNNTTTMFTARMRTEVGDRSNVARLRLQFRTSDDKYEYILFAHKSESIKAIGLAWLKHLWQVESEDRVSSFGYILKYGEKGKPCARPFRYHAD